ncbi:hypothetical protein Pla175_09790 [Pirellulimonas nuda]|uniref:Uncharacterized protein n=1 Tax=Pirellulimonas nuda TaxID=2528009 RepID=A0A518D826_9BACT|nr:hypothetical protein [Pirellulimonas nuda]QDU87614.1 hypothetical protein Pla175_09790 [Pirellulimonas nuda]
MSKKSKSITKKPARFGMETMEKREMMAGDVTASIQSGGHLYIGEAVGNYQTANAVQVSQLSNGQIRVQGITNLDGTVTKVNGAAYKDFTVTGDLQVNLGAGNDKVVLAGGANFRNVTLNMDQLGGPADADQVFVGSIRTTGGMTVRTGAGNDYVSFYNSSIGNDASDFTSISTGAGVDSLRVEGWSSFRGGMGVSTYNNVNENETDYVDMVGAVVYGTLAMNTGAGNDVLNMTGVTMGGNLFLNTGDGADTVRLREVQTIDDFYVSLGNGDDNLDLVYCRADHMQLDGGAGTDKLTRSQDGPVNSKTEVNFEPSMSFWSAYGSTLTSSKSAMLR